MDDTRTFRPEIVVVWLLLLVVAAELLVTYSRLSPHELYHVSGHGFSAGVGRVLVFLNFPTALVALAVLPLLADRLGGRAAGAVAAVGAPLCAVVFLPGVVDQADLDAKWSNVPSALGVALAVGLTIAAARRMPRGRLGRLPGDPLRVAVAAAAFLLAVPWIAADLGFSFDGIPLFGTLYQTGELRTQPGDPILHPAVHHGHHHGMDGFLLVLSALVLSRLLPTARRAWLRAVTGAYLALMLAYGMGNIANDFWLEQVVKRHWTSLEIPDVTKPTVSVAWAILAAGAVAIFVAGAWRARGGKQEVATAAVVTGA